jgi:hypothetical protein
MERGFLTSAAEGYQSNEAAADFERCLRLSGKLTDDQLFSTLIALANYYLVCADLRRAGQVIKSLREGPQEQQWTRQVIDTLVGALAYLHGDFVTAASAFAETIAGVAASDQHKVDVESNCLYRAWVALVRGDLAGAETELERSAHLARESGFPQGPYLHAYTRSMATWLHIEAGQLDRAAIVAAESINDAERHGFDMWRLMGITWDAAVSALAAHSSADIDTTALNAHIATFTASLNALRRMDVNIYTTMLDGVLARLLIDTCAPEQARERLDIGLALAHDTGMSFYDAELLRLRGLTHDDLAARQSEINRALELARRQTATLFELRAALDAFDVRGRGAAPDIVDAANRIPANADWPEIVRARAVVGDLRGTGVQ